jgi:hypothetical protein
MMKKERIEERSVTGHLISTSLMFVLLAPCCILSCLLVENPMRYYFKLHVANSLLFVRVGNNNGLRSLMRRNVLLHISVNHPTCLNMAQVSQWLRVMEGYPDIYISYVFAF